MISADPLVVVLTAALILSASVSVWAAVQAWRSRPPEEPMSLLVREVADSLEKEPWAWDHKQGGGAGPRTTRGHIKVRGEYRDVCGATYQPDVLVSGDRVNPSWGARRRLKKALSSYASWREAAERGRLNYITQKALDGEL